MSPLLRCCSVCPILLGQVEIWQDGRSSLAPMGKPIEKLKKINSELMDSPGPEAGGVVSLSVGHVLIRIAFIFHLCLNYEVVVIEVGRHRTR